MSFLEKIDKEKVQKILLIVIAALVLAALVSLVVIIITSLAGPYSEISKIEFELTDLTLTEQQTNTGSLILADANHPYTVGDEEWLDLQGCQYYRNEQMKADGVDTVPANNYYIAYPSMRLSFDAMQAAHNMLRDAKKSVGGNALCIDGAYGQIVNGEEVVEYKTGMLLLVADFASEENAPVALSSAHKKWFDNNAAGYGFIESFDDAYRYVGVPHASYMNDKELSLSQYIEYLKKNTNSSTGLKIKVDGATYMVYYLEGKTGDTVKVPASTSYNLSGTNEGGVIVTVKTK